MLSSVTHMEEPAEVLSEVWDKYLTSLSMLSSPTMVAKLLQLLVAVLVMEVRTIL